MIFFILDQLEQDDKEKFEELYLRHCDRMLKIAYGILKSHELAEDAVQEAFVRLFKNLKKVTNLESRQTSGFLTIIIQHVSYTMYNNNKKRNEVLPFEDIESIVEEGELGDPTWENLSMLEAKNTIVEIIRDFPQKDKDLFLLRTYYRWSCQEVGAAFGMTERHVAVKYGRIKKKIIKEYCKRTEERNV